MQMHHVGLAELLCLCDVEAAVGYVDVEKMLPAAVQAQEDAEPFPEEMAALPPGTAQCRHPDVVGLAVAHQHLRLYAVVAECGHQPARGHGGTAGALACIYYQYSHGY